MYSKKIKTVAQLLIVVCLVVFASCKKTKSIELLDIVIDNMEIKGVTLDGDLSDVKYNIVYVGDSVVIGFNGTIGPTKCYVLYDFILSRPFEPTEIFVEAWGTIEDRDGCKLEESLLNHTITVVFEAQGTYNFYDHNQSDKKLGEIIVKE